MVYYFDIETTGLDPSRGQIVSMQLLDNSGCYTYVDINQNNFQKYFNEIVDIVCSVENEVVCHNASFEYSWIRWHFNKEIVNLHDTMALLFVHDLGEPFEYELGGKGSAGRNNRKKLQSVGLKRLARYYLGVEAKEEALFASLGTKQSPGILKVINFLFFKNGKVDENEEIVFSKKDKKKLDVYFSSTVLDGLLSNLYACFKEYAKNDVYYTRALWEKFGELRDTSAYRIERHFIPILYDIWKNGMPCNLFYLNKIKTLYQQREDILLYHLRFLLNSPTFGLGRGEKQSAIQVLKDKGFDLEETETGQLSISKKTLVGSTKWHTKVIKKLSQYQRIKALKSTFISGIIKKEVDGTVHPNYNSFGTVHGRLSASLWLNLIKNPILRGLAAPEGWQFVFFDYSQIELRLAAVYLNDTIWLKEYNESSPDLHWRTCVESLGADCVERLGLPKKTIRRDFGKAFNFGTAYGAGVAKVDEMLCAMLDKPKGTFIGPAYKEYRKWLDKKMNGGEYKDWKKPEDFSGDLGQAYLILARFKKAHPSFKEFYDNIKKETQQKGYFESLFGRRYKIPQRMHYKALEYKVSGHATGDLAKAQAIRIHKKLQGYESYLCALEHDGFICLVKDFEAGEVIPLIKKTLEYSRMLNGKIPIPVEIKLGKNWYDTYEMKL